MQYAQLPTQDQLDRLANALAPGGTIGLGPRLTGGLDNTMDVLEVKDAYDSTVRLVLRRYNLHHSVSIVARTAEPALEVLQRELAALRVATRGGVPAPDAIWSDTTGVFDQPAIVISYIDGKPELLPTDPIDWADQMAAALAKIHGCLFNHGERVALLDFHTDLADGINVADVPKRFAQHPLGTWLWEHTRDELKEYAAPDPTFLHCDYHPGQILWNNNRLVGVVDWQDGGFGDPISDVAYCVCDMHYCGYPEAAQRFVDTYRSITGRSLDSLPLWTLVALGRPMPDVARWAQSWHAVGRTDLTLDLLRRRHTDLIERALSG